MLGKANFTALLKTVLHDVSSLSLEEIMLRATSLQRTTHNREDLCFILTSCAFKIEVRDIPGVSLWHPTESWCGADWSIPWA